MSAAEYWDALERLLNDEYLKDLPDKLIEKGWAPAHNRGALVEFFAEHDGVYCFDDDEDRCQCGKWIEWNHYEWPDHVSSELEDSGLLTPSRPWETSL